MTGSVYAEILLACIQIVPFGAFNFVENCGHDLPVSRDQM